MIGPGLASAAFVAYVTGYPAGLAGILTVSIEDSNGNVVLAPTTAGVVEIDAGPVNSIYRYAGTNPAVVGNYVLIWENTDGVQASEELVVSTVAATVPGDGWYGPVEPWTDGAGVAECCATDVGTFTELLDLVALEASQVLFTLSGSRYTGVLERTVRPCKTRPGCTGSWGPYNDLGSSCGCGRLSQVLLPGFPALTIVEVLVDGEAVASSTYRIDEHELLTRVRDPADPDTPLFWPACQHLDLDDSQEGTFSVRYVSGIAPPALGVAAANELACQLFLACPESAGAGECQLPTGATEIVRQGVTIKLGEFTSWGFRDGRWHTGLALVDMFLNVYNPAGKTRPPAIWSPDGPQFARKVGT